ncbi:MAG: PAS domain-containing protein [Magnetococcales bacterium]|nr:PAS domain-containing protein [Magnetococcales bacterium]
MSWLAAWIARRPGVTWILILSMSIALALATGEHFRSEHERARLIRLNTLVERSAVELMALTLNGNAMGSVAMLGLIDPKVKQDARQEGAPNDPGLLAMLESVGHPYEAEGVFVVAGHGVVRTSWDSSGNLATGLNVAFRPYFQMAMQGRQSIYAAVSLSTGRRAIYFAAPVFAEPVATAARIGAMVSRTGPGQIDRLLASRADMALLLSPQGVVFAANPSEWIGFLEGEPTPERLDAIRDLKQFGKLFDNRSPELLPVAVAPGYQLFEGRRHAVASAKVSWNDPHGDWRLVLYEDLTRSVPLAGRVREMVIGGLVALAIWVLILKMLRGHHAQEVAAAKLQAYATRQEVSARDKSRLATASLHMQQAKGIEELARIFLHEAHELLGMMQGAIYAFPTSGTGSMRLAASFARERDLPEELMPGQGLLGQCVVERRALVLTAPSEHLKAIRSGLGESPPEAVVLMPILLNDVVLGAVEMAMFGEVCPESGAIREEMVAILALNLEIQRRNRDAERLLTATAAAERVKSGQLVFQQALVDTIPYPVFYKGVDTRFLGFNRAYEETFNTRREQLVGKRVLDLDYLPEADRLAYQAEDESVIASGGTVRREVSMPYGDGSMRETIYYASGFRLPDGAPGGMVGTFIDISDMRHSERMLMRMSDIGFNRLVKTSQQRIRALEVEVNQLAMAAGRPPPYPLETGL